MAQLLLPPADFDYFSIKKRKYYIISKRKMKPSIGNLKIKKAASCCGLLYGKLMAR